MKSKAVTQYYNKYNNTWILKSDKNGKIVDVEKKPFPKARKGS